MAQRNRGSVSLKQEASQLKVRRDHPKVAHKKKKKMVAHSYITNA